MINFRTIFVSVVTAFILMNFAACSSDDDNKNQTDDSPKVAGYLFELGLSRIEGTDNADLIKTTYSFINNQGKEETGTFKEKLTINNKITSQLFTKLPATLIVKVKEELIPDVQYTKGLYKLGSDISFSIYSLADDQTLIDYKSKADNNMMNLAVVNLTKMYPNTIVFSYKIDEKGTIKEVTTTEQ